MSKNRRLKTGVSIIIGLIFIISAWFKLMSIDSFEIYTYSFGLLNLNSSFFIARFIISFELLLGVLLVIGFFPKQIIYTSLAMLISFSTFLGFLLLNSESEHCHCFGDLVEMSHIQSTIKNITLILLLIFIRNHNPIKIRYAKIITLVLIIISFSLPFIISPPDSFSFKKYSSKISYEKENLNKYLTEQNELNGRKVLCFFGASCRFCKLSAKKISVISQKAGGSGLIKYVFWGDDNKIDNFFTDTNTEPFPYSTIEGNQFLKITDGKMPLILLLEDDSVVQKFGYRDINEKVILDFLMEK